LPVSGAPIVGSRRRGVLASGIGAIVAAVVVAVTAWWLWPMTKSSPTATPAGAATTQIGQALAAPRLSIVVLPFVNLSNDADQQFFADGITEDLTTDLSRVAHMFVISRNSDSTAILAICSRSKAISRGGSRSRSTLGWLPRKPLGQANGLTRWTTSCADEPRN
jgi:hypothetical protein